MTVRRHVLLVHFLHAVLQNRALTNQTFSRQALEEHIEGTSDSFLANLDRMRIEARKAAILFVVGNQQAKSLRYDMQEIRGITYADEVETLEQVMSEQGHVKLSEGHLITHSVLMQDLEGWARASGVPFVDVIDATDQHRHALLSWVHLNPHGNRLVAEAFAEVIGKHLCP